MLYDVYSYKDRNYYFIEVLQDESNDKKVVLYQDENKVKYIRDLKDFKEKFKKEVYLKDYQLSEFLFTEERALIKRMLDEKGIFLRIKTFRNYESYIVNLGELKNIHNMLKSRKESRPLYKNTSTFLNTISKVSAKIEAIESEKSSICA